MQPIRSWTNRILEADTTTLILQSWISNDIL
jgi:hypothetical protein